MLDDKSPEEAVADIDRRLRALREERSSESGGKTSSKGAAVGRMMWLAFNVVSDLIAGVICGLGIGYGLDLWLGTRPAFIAVFLLFGCAAGVLNAVRFVQRYDQKQQERSVSEKTDAEHDGTKERVGTDRTI